MTENDLIELGFTKVEYTKEDLEELGDFSDPYRYYRFVLYDDPDIEDPDDNVFVLESRATFDMTQKEINGDGWSVELFDSDLFEWDKKEDISILKMLLLDGLKPQTD